MAKGMPPRIGLPRTRSACCRKASNKAEPHDVTFSTKGRDIRLTVHGDDFLVVADTEQLAWLDAKLRQQYDMKSEVLGPEANRNKLFDFSTAHFAGERRRSSMRRTTGTRSRSCKNAQ